MFTIDNTTSSDRSDGRVYEIGEVAELVTLSLRTTRFYADAGLLVPVGRTEGGYGLYDADALDRLLLIKKMKPLGFTLEEMRSLLALRAEINTPGLSPERRKELRRRLQTWMDLAEEKLALLQKQVRDAEAFKNVLCSGAVGIRFGETDLGR